jgi:type I restriction enzyme S subunit
MIDGLKPNRAMKDSGVPWLGKVPEHWEVKRNKLFLREVNERSEDGSEELLTVSQYTGVTRRRERMSDEGDLLTNAASLVGYKRVSAGDLVMNIMLAWNGSLGVSAIEGIASPAYCVFRADISVEPMFLHHLLRTPLFTGVFKTVSTGVVDSRLRLYPDIFLRLPSLLPPHHEQCAIVRFLDHADRRIRRYIRAKQNLIKLLEEQKQAIIHRAVTRGLDPNVRLKPSGVGWLGDVPEHWEVLPLRRVTIARCDGPFGSGLKSSHYTSNGIRVIRLQNIGHAAFRGADAAFIAPAYYATLGDHSVEMGDVLVAGLGDERHPAGRACVAPASIVPAMVKADCFRFRLDPRRVNADFAALHLTATAVAASAILSTGATRQRTNLQSTASRAIGVPLTP